MGEGFLVLLGIIVLAIPVAVVYLLISNVRILRDLRAVRGELNALRSSEGAGPDTAARGEAPAHSASQTAPVPAVSRSAKDPWGAAKEVSGAPGATPPSSASSEPAAKQPESAQPEPVAPAATEAEPPRAVVMRRDTIRRFERWITANWIYAVSALSLALAGLFLVQYGVEHGLLGPRIRVVMALCLGAALVGAGEVIRRRYGDGDGASTVYLPSVFSGAGIVTLLAAILSARLLYDLISPELALIVMAAVAFLALVLGWFHGPLLAAIGIIGAVAVPFLVGGTSEDPQWLFAYFAVIAALGLGIDTMRRWAWITGLTLVLVFAAGSVVFLGETGAGAGFGAYLAALALLAVLVPARSISPDHGGTMVVEMVIKTPEMRWTEFPTRVAFGASLAASIGLVVVSFAGMTEFWLAVGILAGLAAALILWSWRAEALQDVALIPVIALLCAIFWQGDWRMEAWRAFHATYETNPEARFPLQVTVLVAMAAGLSSLAVLRALASQGSGARFALIWAGAGALIAPLAAIALELSWRPAEVIGAYGWALHAAALAALMVWFAQRLARVDGAQDRLRTSLPVLSAVSAMAFAFTILFAETALTLAFVATVVATAALDRAYRMPLMTGFIAAGVSVIGYRLVADPGLDFAFDGPLLQVLLAYGGALGGFFAALRLLAGCERPISKTFLESAAMSTAGVLVSVLLYRWLNSLAGTDGLTHWAMGLYAVIWFALMSAQLLRLPLGGLLANARMLLAGLFGLFGFGVLFYGLSVANPLVSPSATVLGPPLLNSLAIAYLLPALALRVIARRVAGMEDWVRRLFEGVAIALAVLWVFAVIRHFWQGSGLIALGRATSQPELYSYTVALILAGAGLFYQSLAKRSAVMRRVGLGVIGLAIAKVFFVDAAGLTGLIRVFSFLLLGLALAALAWLGQWSERRAGPPPDEEG